MLEYNPNSELVSREQVIFTIHRFCLENGIPDEIFFPIKQAVESVKEVDLNKAVEFYLLACMIERDGQ